MHTIKRQNTLIYEKLKVGTFYELVLRLMHGGQRYLLIHVQDIHKACTNVLTLQNILEAKVSIPESSVSLISILMQIVANRTSGISYEIECQFYSF